ncbi:MAG: hypothetical protein VYD19_01375 [Myxococcota bacterium]|nr:hypothetical protein [Myxococcota bacterium]
MTRVISQLILLGGLLLLIIHPVAYGAPEDTGEGPRAVASPPLEAVVSADSALASQLGAEILAKGGDAADAAVTVALALGVLHPVG